MATISNPSTIRQLLVDIRAKPKRNHHIEEIWEYVHKPTKKIVYAIFSKAYLNDLKDNPFVGPHLLLWSKALGFQHDVGALQQALDRQAQEQQKPTQPTLAPHLRRKPRKD